MAMFGNKLVLPTGYEAAQLKAEQKRKLAQALLERSLQTNPNMQSWGQVIAQMGSALAGKVLSNKADKLDATTRAQELSDYHNASTDFAKDEGTLDPQAMVDKYSESPWMQERVKPYAEALQKRLTERENLTNFGGKVGVRTGDVMGQYDPGKATDSVRTNPDGSIYVNPVRTTAALLAQGYTPNGQAPSATMSMPGPGGGPAPAAKPMGLPGGDPTGGGMSFNSQNIGAVESGNHDFNPDGTPMRSSAGALYGMQVMPSTAHDPGYGVRPAASDTPSEYNRVGRDYAAAMLKKYGGDPLKAASAYNGGPGRTDSAIAANGTNFLGAMPPETQHYAQKFANPKPPAGVVNGKPYWLINGVPFDNPDGN